MTSKQKENLLLWAMTATGAFMFAGGLRYFFRAVLLLFPNLFTY